MPTPIKIIGIVLAIIAIIVMNLSFSKEDNKRFNITSLLLIGLLFIYGIY